MTSISEADSARPHPARDGNASTGRDATATLLSSLPEGHPYRALAEGAYRPSRATDDDRWGSRKKQSS